MRVVPVVDLDDPRVELYRSLRRVAKLRADRTFVAEGARVVEKLLRSPLRVRSLLLDQRWLDALEERLEARPEDDITAYVTTKRELERIVGFHVHQGVMAIAEAPDPPPMVPTLRERPGHLVVALCGIAQADNVGGILRSAAGFGAAGVLLDSATCDPFVRRAARVSMGAVFHLPVWRVDDMPGALRRLRAECGTRVLAAHLHDPCVELGSAPLGGNLGLVLGAEATGVPADVVAACDASVRIPMDESWDCLNVATAGAIILWEIARQRGGAAG